jgi:uncharacterized protein YdeI (YjbR/CyaY-like superfamily)
VNDIPEVHAPTRREWREWLVENHARLPAVWLVFYKKHTGVATVAYDAAVEEALCFGWIDTTLRRLDDQRYARKFTPRQRGSQWSLLNRRRAEKMMAAGKMTSAGRRKVAEARREGAWERALADHVDRAIPPELEQALAADATAAANFRRWTPTQRKYLINWVASAKKEATRLSRAARAVVMCRRNRRPGM